MQTATNTESNVALLLQFEFSQFREIIAIGLMMKVDDSMTSPTWLIEDGS